MNRVTAAMIGLGLLSAASAAAGCAPGPAAKLSAEEIVARNVAARGGLEAWRKVQTMVWIGHIESAHAPMPSMPFKLEMQRPNRARLEINSVGSKSVRVFNGVRGWKLSPGRGRQAVVPYESQELKFAQEGHGIDGPLIDYAAKGSSVTLEGVDELEGRKAFHLKVRLAKGGTEDVWVDCETYLDLRDDRMADGPAGSQRRVSVTYGDYRSVEGLRVPFQIATGKAPGTTSPDRMRIESVFLNAPLDHSTFENPVAAARWGHRASSRVAARAAATPASPEQQGVEPP